MLRSVVNTLWYSTTNDIHRDLYIPYVKEDIGKITGKHKVSVHKPTITEAIQIVGNLNNRRRLKRIRQADLV